jgi:hypothetical protein
MTCYSLRLNLGTSILPSARVKHEDSALPEQRLPIIGENGFRKRHLFWFLSDPLGETPSISMPDLQEDLLHQFRDSLLSTSASPRHV